MSGEKSSAEIIAEMKAAAKRALEQDPLDEQREAAARRAEQEKADRIAAEAPRRIREQKTVLMSDVPDDIIDERLAKRWEAEGIAETRQPRLPAELEKARLEEKHHFARELLIDQFGAMAEREFWTMSPGADWERHVKGLNLSFRERVRFEAEAEGRQLTETGLNDEEAVRNAHYVDRDGIHGPFSGEVDRYIEIARGNGNWPLPELHTGPGSMPLPRDYHFEQFKSSCESSARPHDSKTGDMDDGSAFGEKSAAGQRAYVPPKSTVRHISAPIRRLPSQQRPQFRMEPPVGGGPALAGAELRAGQSGVNGLKGDPLPRHGRQGMRDRIKSMLMLIPQKIFGYGEHRRSPSQAPSIPDRPTEVGAKVIRPQNLPQLSLQQANGRAAAPGADSNSARASMIAKRYERALMIANREREPRSAANSR